MNPSLRSCFLSAGIVGGLAPVLVAQTSSVVVPNGYADLEGTSAARTPFGWASGRVQYLVDGAQLCQSQAVLTNLQFRLDGGNFNVDAPVAKTFTATLVAYEVPIPPSAMSSQWAVNIGSATGTTLYQGTLAVPAASRTWPYPNPWTIDLVLQQPFVYSRGNGNLLLDLTVTGGSGDNWPADGFFVHGTEARGEVTRIHEDLACTNARGDTLRLDVPQVAGNGVLGGQLQVTHLATAGAGGSLDFVYHLIGLDHRQSGSVPLPIPLAPLGYPGCQQNVDALLGQFVPASAGQCLWTLPSDPSFLGVALFTQAAAFDLVQGFVVPSRTSWQVRVGDVVAPPFPAQMVHRSNYSAQPDGSLSPTGCYGMVVRFVGTFL